MKTPVPDYISLNVEVPQGTFAGPFSDWCLRCTINKLIWQLYDTNCRLGHTVERCQWHDSSLNTDKTETIFLIWLRKIFRSFMLQYQVSIHIVYHNIFHYHVKSEHKDCASKLSCPIRSYTAHFQVFA